MTKFLDYFTENTYIENHNYNNIKNEMKLIDIIRSPLDDNSIKSVLTTIQKYKNEGLIHLLLENYKNKYGKNYLLPYYENGIIKDLLIITDDHDSNILLKMNLNKMPNYKHILLDSILSTTDINSWKIQRNNLNTIFLPNNLNKKITLMNNIAKESVKRLLNYKILSNNNIDILDFFSYETLLQLHVVLFGFSIYESNKINKKIRLAFDGKAIKKGYIRDYIFKVIEQLRNNKLNGDLANKLKILPQKTDTELYANILTFTFAGHDTTASTLSFLIYELCKNEKLQNILRKEVLKFWNYNDDSNTITINEINNLKIMSKFLAETLRKWPAVANGTFRVIDKDHLINNTKIPKGTYFQVLNYLKHRDNKLWDNVNIFNPFRNFTADEIDNITNLSFINPSSNRYSPFSHGKRSCIGRSFSQIEMRLILLYLLKNFIFSFSKNYDETNIKFLNIGTLKPINLLVSIKQYSKI